MIQGAVPIGYSAFLFIIFLLFHTFIYAKIIIVVDVINDIRGHFNEFI